MKLQNIILLGLAATRLQGCVNVEPYERSFLAQDNMKLDPHYLDSRYARHMYFAREAIPGGYGADPTGCGCN